MVDVLKSMAPSHSAWADAPSQLVSSRLEHGARLSSTPSTSIDSNRSSYRLERAESLLSTASATITKASSTTIRKVERTNAAPRPIRFAKSKKDSESVTPSSSVERMSSKSTEATDHQASAAFPPDSTQSSLVTSFDTTLPTSSNSSLDPTSKHARSSSSTTRNATSANLFEPKSFFSESVSADESLASTSASTLLLRSLDAHAVSGVPVADGAPRDDGPSHSSEMPQPSSSSQTATYSDSNPTESLASQNTTSQPIRAATLSKYGRGLGILTGGSASSSQQPLESSSSVARYLPGHSLAVVPEARESPYLGSGARLMPTSADMTAPSTLSISSSLPTNLEPVWGESSSVVNDDASDPAFGTLATFSFPFAGPSSANSSDASTKAAASLSTSYPRPSGSAFHSSNPSIQSSASNTNPRHLPATANANGMRLLHASPWGHAPPSSYAGSIVSSIGPASSLGVNTLNPTNRQDMLHRLLLDQARVDCQEYGTMSLEQVAEAKRELKHVERKVHTLRTKLKVEIKIRDAAVALRKAHRRTVASAHSPTSSVTFAVSPTSAAFTVPPRSGPSLSSSSSSSSSFAARSRVLSMSSGEAKAEEDVATATAKVDKVANDLFKWTDRASLLRRRILEHQAATLSERVQHLESDTPAMQDKLPFLTASTSFESLAPSASVSAVGVDRYRNLGHGYQQSTNKSYFPRGPEDPLRHNRLESDLSAISGFSFFDVSAPDKVRRLNEDLERKSELIRKLELDLEAANQAAQRRDDTSNRLTQQLEEQSRERIRAVDELIQLQEQMNQLEENARSAQTQAIQVAIAEAEQRLQKELEEERARGKEKEDALVNTKAELLAGQRGLNELQTHLDASLAEAEQLRTRVAAAESAAEEHKRSLDNAKAGSARQLSQDLASLRSEIGAVKAGETAASVLAADRAKTIVELEAVIKQINSELSAEKQAHAQAEQQYTQTQAQLVQTTEQLQRSKGNLTQMEEQVRIANEQLSRTTGQLAETQERLTAAQGQVTELRAQADLEASKLRKLELAVGAERRIMAERDELFHAFERRLESAEQRLQEQDKRCARMLGKLEGREEMDDLLERIKAGASGVAKKKKTAGQDIAGLLTSLETHIGDLELELARANTGSSVSPRDTTGGLDSSGPSALDAELQASVKEAQHWKIEAERLKTVLESQPAHQPQISTEEQTRVQEMQAELRRLSERHEESKRQDSQKVAQLEAEVGTLSDKKKELEQEVERIKQLESKVEQLERRNLELEKQLRNPSSPAGSISALPPRASKTASPLSATFPSQNKGVGNLIDKFGGGRKVPADLRAEDSPAVLQECLRSAEALRAMLPDLPAAAKGSADLRALRDAFQAHTPISPSSKAARSPSSVRSPLGASDLQSELDAIAERVRSTLAISRAVIDLALESEADKENTGPSEQSKDSHAAQARTDALASQQALMTRITSLTAKVKEQVAKENRLKAELAEVKEQLDRARTPERMPSSPAGLVPGSDSMLGLSSLAPKAVDLSNLPNLPTSFSRSSSSRSLRLFGDRPSPIATGSNIVGAASLAPPRSPSRYNTLPSPTRSNTSAHVSPSIRYISPSIAPSFEPRCQQRAIPDSRSMGSDSVTVNAPLSESSHNMEASDSMSLRSSISPSSTHIGLPTSTTSLANTSQSSISAQRPGDSSVPNGVIQRTITLGMDVPQLVSRVRELEKQLSQTATIRQRAERVAELEVQLREANQAYSNLLDRMDTERKIGMHQKVEMLNELNETQSKLQTTKAQMQRVQAVSPLVSTLEAPKPPPPPKD